jgi:hypothetical protein
MICKWCHAFLNIVDDTIDHNYRSMNLICSFSFVWCEIHTCTVTKESPIYTSQQKKRYKDIFEIYFNAKTKIIVYYHLRQCVHKTNNRIPFRYGKIPESQFPSHDWIFDDRITHLNQLRSLIVLSSKVNNLPFWKFEFSQERDATTPSKWPWASVGMVKAGMTHQAVADHFNVSRVTISRLMIRLRQTGRTNDRPVTAGHVWRHTVETDMYALFTFWAVWKRMRTLP